MTGAKEETEKVYLEYLEKGTWKRRTHSYPNMIPICVPVYFVLASSP